MRPIILTPKVIERFPSKMDRSGGPDACWPWLGRTDHKGYGLTTSKDRDLRAHRIAWAIANGRDPGDLFVLHECDNPPCCNPAHLFLGTLLDNNRDRDVKGRARFLTMYGERNGLSKLTDVRVREIRRRYAEGDATITMLSREHGVDRKIIRQVIRRERWRHVA